jgi:hypothetical protein
MCYFGYWFGRTQDTYLVMDGTCCFAPLRPACIGIMAGSDWSLTVQLFCAWGGFRLHQASSTADSDSQTQKAPRAPCLFQIPLLDNFLTVRMTRWHKPDCSAPDIVVDTTRTPSCLTCGATPDLDEIIRQQAHESPFPAPPPDQPRGKMNLWWPRSVPYLTSEPSTNSNSDPDQPHPHPAPEPPTPEPAKQHSLIYPTPLKQGEFRLACLTAPPSTSTSTPPNTGTTRIAPAEYPVHLTLETYPLSNCPAYETVSYCWAGEDGDSTRRHPVFVGEYWDVILQTRNCWELLRFVRPGRGVRMVWVDAVCIDQGW